MKLMFFGLVFLGYFQLFAFTDSSASSVDFSLNCPYGEQFELSVNCSQSKEALALNSFRAVFILDKTASAELTEQHANKIKTACVYLTEDFTAQYGFSGSTERESIVITSSSEIKSFLEKLHEDPNFPSWLLGESELLSRPEFRYIEPLPVLTSNSSENPLASVTVEKNKLKIGVGMSFNGKIALERNTSAYSIAVGRRLDPNSSLYVIAQNCSSQIKTEDGKSFPINF